MMQQVPRTRLTAPAVAGQLERGVRPHPRAEGLGCAYPRGVVLPNLASVEHQQRARLVPWQVCTFREVL